jgi:hypothetical protein
MPVDPTWPPAWTLLPPRTQALPFITTGWLVEERLREVREQIAIAKLIEREWSKEYR